MILKKSKLTYICWIFFIILGFGSLYVASNKNSFLLSGLPVDAFVAGITLFALLLVVAEILTVCSKFVAKFSKGKELEAGSFIETIIIFFVLVASFMSRFIYITSINGVPTKGNDFVDSVMQGGGASVGFSFIQHIYACLINAFSGVLSTPAVGAMYINVVFQLMIIILLYFGIRKMMGLVPAVVSILFMAFLPSNIMMVGHIDSDFLYALLVLVSLFTMIIAKWGVINDKMPHGFRLFLFVLSGFVTSLCILSDKALLGIVIFAIALFVAYKKDSPLSNGESKGEILLFVIGLIVGSIIFLNVFDSYYGLGMFGYINRYFNDFSNISINTNLVIPGINDPFVLISMVLAIVWTFRIFKIDRDHGSIIVFVPFVIALFSFLSLTKDDYAVTYVMLWSVLGAMGFVSIGKNSLAYIEEERAAKQKAEQQRHEQLEAAKKELEEKKAKLAEINKKKKEKEINIGTTAMTDTQNLKELEASLDFLKKDNNSETQNDVSEEVDTTDSHSVENVGATETTDTIDANDSAVEVSESSVATEDSQEVNNNVVLPEKKDEKKLDLKAAPIPKEEKPRYVSMSSPSSKFARRMDYRTAIVKANHVEEESAPEEKKVPEASNESVVKAVETPVEKAAESTEAITDNAESVANGTSSKSTENDAVSEAVRVAISDNNDVEATNNDNAEKQDSEPDLLSVNIIESHDIVIEEEQDENVVFESIAEEKVIDENVLDLTKLEKHELTNEPAPAPEVNPVSAQEPVLRSVAQQKPPIMGKETEPVNKIHNPLPTPKKHTSRELDYDVEPLPADLHFDIVDLTGIDFFDIN